MHFENLSLPKFLNIILVAPSGSGKMLRSAYKDGTGIPNLFAVNNDYSKNSRQLALEYSKAIVVVELEFVKLHLLKKLKLICLESR